MQNMTLSQMRDVDIRTIDPNTLVDLRDVKIQPEIPKEERIKEFIRQIKNPYCYRVGKVVVKVSYSNNGATLEDRLQSLLMRL